MFIRDLLDLAYNINEGFNDIRAIDLIKTIIFQIIPMWSLPKNASRLCGMRTNYRPINV